VPPAGDGDENGVGFKVGVQVVRVANQAPIDKRICHQINNTLDAQLPGWSVTRLPVASCKLVTHNQLQAPLRNCT